jgi:predicted DNA-binding transcriptional regulator YafY
MFTDKIETITFWAGDWIVDQVVDWFGFDSKIEQVGDKFKVTVRVSPNAMEYWAMQYLNAVEVLSPLELRERIKKNVQVANEKYKR